METIEELLKNRNQKVTSWMTLKLKISTFRVGKNWYSRFLNNVKNPGYRKVKRHLFSRER